MPDTEFGHALCGRGGSAPADDGDLEAGIDALQSGDLATARQLLGDVVNADGSNARAWKALYETCRRSEDWDGCLNALNGVIYATRAASEVIQAYADKARILDEELQRPDKAKSHYERILQFDDPKWAQHWLALLRDQRTAVNADLSAALGVPIEVITPWYFKGR